MYLHAISQSWCGFYETMQPLMAQTRRSAASKVCIVCCMLSPTFLAFLKTYRSIRAFHKPALIQEFWVVADRKRVISHHIECSASWYPCACTSPPWAIMVHLDLRKVRTCRRLYNECNRTLWTKYLRLGRFRNLLDFHEQSYLSPHTNTEGYLHVSGHGPRLEQVRCYPQSPS